MWVGEGETRAQTRQSKGFSRDKSLEQVRAGPAVAPLEASVCASDALGKCRPAARVGEGETQAQMRQRRGFSRDKSLERVRAEPAVAVLKVIAASEESGKPAVAPPSTLTGPRPVIQSFQCNEFSNRNHIA